jgi:hypothetical protein
MEMPREETVTNSFKVTIKTIINLSQGGVMAQK